MRKRTAKTAPGSVRGKRPNEGITHLRESAPVFAPQSTED
jgi:hypothetical protein